MIIPKTPLFVNSIMKIAAFPLNFHSVCLRNQVFEYRFRQVLIVLGNGKDHLHIVAGQDIELFEQRAELIVVSATKTSLMS